MHHAGSMKWHGLRPLKLNTGDKWLPCCWECNLKWEKVKWTHKIYLCTRTRSVDPCNNAYCMQPSFTELALCTPCSRLWQRKCARPLWRVLREGASVALQLQLQLKVFQPTSLPHCFFHFHCLFLYALFWSVTGKPPDTFVFISSFYLFMAWPNSSSPEANLLATQPQLLWNASSYFFMDHYGMGGWGSLEHLQNLARLRTGKWEQVNELHWSI